MLLILREHATGLPALIDIEQVAAITPEQSDEDASLSSVVVLRQGLHIRVRESTRQIAAQTLRARRQIKSEVDRLYAAALRTPPQATPAKPQLWAVDDPAGDAVPPIDFTVN